jgi:hypothetical protein
MDNELMTETWERLRALNHGMDHIAGLFEAEQWEEIGEELRGQESRAREFSRWLGERFQAPVVGGDMAHRCCQELQGQLKLVGEFRGALGRRRVELLEEMEGLNQQQRVAKEYGRSRPGPGGTAKAEARSLKTEELGSPKPRFRSRAWGHRQLATYGLNRD